MFMLIVRLSFPFGNKICKYIIDVLQRCLFFGNSLVTVSSVSNMRSSMTTKFLFLESKDDKSGRPSTHSKFGCMVERVEYNGCYSP